MGKKSGRCSKSMTYTIFRGSVHMLRILEGEMFFLRTHFGITREDSDGAANGNAELSPL
jgi:hypothetical protein